MKERHAMVLLGILLFLVFSVYAIALPGPFHFDDLATVAVDPSLQHMAAWWEDVSRHVRPLLKASFVLTYAMGDLSSNVPFFHRLGNIMIHLCSIVAFSVLGFGVIRTCMPDVTIRTRRRAAFGAAALFGFHPMATEAVSYISGRSMSLGTLLALLGLLSYMHFRTTPVPHGNAASRKWLIITFLLLLAAVFVRETMAGVVLLFIVWEWARRDREDRAFSAGRLKRTLKVAWVPVVITLALLAWMLFHPRYAFLLEMSGRIAIDRLTDPSFLTAIAYFMRGFCLLQYPNIAPDVTAVTLSLQGRAAGIGALVLIFAFCLRFRNSRPHLLFGFLWTLAWLAPLYVFQVRHDTVTERHFYPALWGPALIIATELALIGRADSIRRTFTMTLLTLLTIILLVVTAARNTNYRTEIALWEAAERSAPNNVRVLNNLGVAYMEASRWQDAQVVLEKAVKMNPGYAKARRNFAAALHQHRPNEGGALMPP